MVELGRRVTFTEFGWPKGFAMNERITKLEIRVAFLEKTLDDLDGVVRELGSQLEGLHREIVSVREESVPSELTASSSESRSRRTTRARLLGASQ